MIKAPEGLVSEVFDTTAKLPHQVFKRSELLGYQLADSAAITMPGAWGVLSRIATRLGDHRIVGAVIDDLRFNDPAIERLPALDESPLAGPAPIGEWLRRRGHNRSEPLYVDARTLAFAGDSQSWGVWADQDIEIVILGVPGGTLGDVREMLAAQDVGPWYEAAEVEQVLGPAYHPNPAPARLLREFRRSYAAVREA